ncbi:hypothetical protein BS17DRAFT_822747 [Gyrodon lividus]|nr:hypothetical protein BS17DRAFT_822747 [Gyrodon lividus]
MFVTEEDLVAMENEVSGQQYASVVQDLNITSTNCAIYLRAPRPSEVAGDCPPEISAEDDHPPRDVNEDQDEDRTDPSIKAQHLRKLFRLHPDTICAQCRDWLPPHAIKGRLPEEEDLGNHPKHVKDWSKGTMFCFPQPTPPVHLPAYKGHRWLPFDVKFDKYKGTPVYKSMKPYRNPYEFVTEPYYYQGTWAMFHDYGWRLQPSFRQMFYLEDPVSVLDHVLVVGVADDYDPSLQVSDHVIGAYSLRRHPDFYPGDNDHVDVPDVFVYGAAEMLALGAINSEQSFNAFVQAMSIFLGPVLDKTAPIKKHNHVYVEVIIPQSEEDASTLGGCIEWWSLPFALSSIPHTSFGTISGGSGGLNVYIFFPRMIHQDKLSGHQVTNIPKEVLDSFCMHVLLPAITKNIEDAQAPYAALTLPEV